MQNINRFILILVALLIFDVVIWSSIVFGAPKDNLELYFLNIGQGDAQLAILPGGATILIDGGPRRAVIDELNSILSPTDRYIDLVILTHPQTDHFEGLIEVFRRYSVGMFLHSGSKGTAPSYRDLEKTLADRGIPTLTIAKPDIIQYRSSRATILWPMPGMSQPKDLNDTSVVVKLDSEGAVALFTGDIGAEVEQKISNDAAYIDILKVAHHGSKYSSSRGFLEATRPKIAVVSAGTNNPYGHPTAETLQRLAAIGARVFRNDTDGAVKLAVDDGVVTIFTAR